MTNPTRTSQAPTWLPVSLEQAKHQVRLALEVSAHDDELRALIRAAIPIVEGDTAVALQAGDFRYTLNGFPAGRPIQLPRRNISSIEKVFYDDGAGTEVDWSDYEFSAGGALPIIVPAGGQAWPATRTGLEVVRIDYKAGYATPGDIPENLAKMVLQAVGALWENDEEREDLGPVYRALNNREHVSYP